MNLFGGRPQPVQSPPVPQIDQAREKVEGQRRTRQLQGRAASMLTQGQVMAQTAQRSNLGN